MKEYLFQIPKNSCQEIGAVREQFDLIEYLLYVMQFFNYEPFEPILFDSKDADIVVVVDKMSRLFWGKGDKIHSIQYPFLLQEEDGYLVSLFQGRIIDSQTIAILSAIFKDKDIIIRSIDDMLDSFMDTMNEFEVQDKGYAQFCWCLLIHLLSFETGYLRYDHDENEDRVDPILHPIDHIDFFYSSNNTFKIGLKHRIVVDDLKSILNINEKCYCLDYNELRGMST